MTSRTLETTVTKAFSAGLGLTAVWVAAAGFRPTATFHLAPLLIAGVVPFLALSSGDRTSLARSVMAGLGLAVSGGLLISGLDWLRGPSLVPFGGPLAEVFAFAPLGAVIGTLIGGAGRRR